MGALLDEVVMTDVNAVGKPSVFACPECHGVTWEVDENGTTHFHCRVGHSYTADGLLTDKDHSLDTALWAALRALEEDAEMRRRVADRMRRRGIVGVLGSIEDKFRPDEAHAAVLRAWLTRAATQPGSEAPALGSSQAV